MRSRPKHLVTKRRGAAHPREHQTHFEHSNSYTRNSPHLPRHLQMCSCLFGRLQHVCRRRHAPRRLRGLLPVEASSGRSGVVLQLCRRHPRRRPRHLGRWKATSSYVRQDHVIEQRKTTSSLVEDDVVLIPRRYVVLQLCRRHPRRRPRHLGRWKATSSYVRQGHVIYAHVDDTRTRPVR